MPAEVRQIIRISCGLAYVLRNHGTQTNLVIACDLPSRTVVMKSSGHPSHVSAAVCWRSGRSICGRHIRAGRRRERSAHGVHHWQGAHYEAYCRSRSIKLACLHALLNVVPAEERLMPDATAVIA